LDQDRRVNYDQIASTYGQRYAVDRLDGVAANLTRLVDEVGATKILEVGCGTGRWLAELRSSSRQVYGLDRSPGMLRQATLARTSPYLVGGQASRLPFHQATFDLIYAVNALHHFFEPRRFLSEARRLLRPKGVLAIIGMDPHSRQDRWYLYDFFEGTYEIDLARFPPQKTHSSWLQEAGFETGRWSIVERIVGQHAGRAVLDNHFIQRHGTSQLTLLTDEAYAAGLKRLGLALDEAEAAGEPLVLAVDISLAMVTARVPP
jgi:SAM-dependent methyltransferase